MFLKFSYFFLDILVSENTIERIKIKDYIKWFYYVFIYLKKQRVINNLK